MTPAEKKRLQARLQAAGHQLTPDGIVALQKQLQAAGYDVKADGVLGETTGTAFDSYQATRAGTNAAETAKAGAEAEKAKAEAEAIRAAAELARIEAENKKRADDAAEKQREFERELTAKSEKEARETREALLKTGINATALGAGLYGGLKYATQIDKRREKAVKAAAPQLDKLAKEATTAVKGYEKSSTPRGTRNSVKKLAGIVKAADGAKLTAKAPRGLGPAAVLLVEGAISRFVIAPNVKNEAAQEAFQALGTASAVAATTIVGKSAINVATPTTPVNAKSLAAVENARAIVKAEKAALRDPTSKAVEAKKPPRGNITSTAKTVGSKALGAVAKFALPVSLGVAIASSVVSEVSAATEETDPTETPADRFARVSKERGQRTFEMADMLTMGALGAISTVINSAMQPRAPAPPTPAMPPMRSGRAYLNQAAETKAQSSVVPAITAPAGAPAAAASTASKTSYTTKDGRTVSVTETQARSYRERRK